MLRGRLFYVVGASGVGKDTLMQYARDTLHDEHAVLFAHRYITRPAGAGGENHVALTAQEFEVRKRHGLFAMTWQSHGLHYAIGIEIDIWLAKGLTVVVNGSRAYISAARRRYPAPISRPVSSVRATTARIRKRSRFAYNTSSPRSRTRFLMSKSCDQYRA
ncbi:MAG: phosphonate metabolism protein/1,5-bisphosphokinase (PRPP-forming) PhnN, partial [Burkholderiales bacterium]